MRRGSTDPGSADWPWNTGPRIGVHHDRDVEKVGAWDWNVAGPAEHRTYGGHRHYAKPWLPPRLRTPRGVEAATPLTAPPARTTIRPTRPPRPGEPFFPDSLSMLRFTYEWQLAGPDPFEVFLRATLSVTEEVNAARRLEETRWLEPSRILAELGQQMTDTMTWYAVRCPGCGTETFVPIEWLIKNRGSLECTACMRSLNHTYLRKPLSMVDRVVPARTLFRQIRDMRIFTWDDGRPPDEVAKDHGVTGARVRQIRRKMEPFRPFLLGTGGSPDRSAAGSTRVARTEALVGERSSV